MLIPMFLGYPVSLQKQNRKKYPFKQIFVSLLLFSYKPFPSQIGSVQPRIIKITDRKLDVVFSRFRGFPFTIAYRSYSQSAQNRLSLSAHNSFGRLPQGYCERKNPKSCRSTVLSVILMNLWVHSSRQKQTNNHQTNLIYI